MQTRLVKLKHEDLVASETIQAKSVLTQSFVDASMVEFSLILVRIFTRSIFFLFKPKHLAGLQTSVLSSFKQHPKISQELTRLCYLVSQTKRQNRWKIVLKLQRWPVCDEFDFRLQPYSDAKTTQHWATFVRSKEANDWISSQFLIIRLFSLV